MEFPVADVSQLACMIPLLQVELSHVPLRTLMMPIKEPSCAPFMVDAEMDQDRAVNNAMIRTSFLVMVAALPVK